MDFFSTTDFTSASMITAISSNVQATLTAIAPVLTLVCGILLAFILAKYIIGLFGFDSGEVPTETVAEEPRLRRVSTGGDEHQEVYIRS